MSIDPIIFSMELINIINRHSYNEKIKVVTIGSNIFIANIAPKFKGSAIKNLNDAKQCFIWKVSSVIDLVTKTVLFCQSDIFGFNNSSLFDTKILGNLLNEIMPEFKNNLKKHLPEDKKTLIQKLYNIHFEVAELIFGSKILIALNEIFKLSQEHIEYILSNIIDKDGNYIYIICNSYKEGVANEITKFINFFATNPLPFDIKIYGHNDYTYGNIQYSESFKTYMKMLDIKIPNLKEKLKEYLTILKTNVVKESVFLSELWKILKNFNIGQISEEGDKWALYNSKNIKKKPQHVSIICYLIMLFTDINDHTSLNNWIITPFGLNIELINKVFKTKNIMAFFEEKIDIYTIRSENYLGNICKNIMTNIFRTRPRLVYEEDQCQELPKLSRSRPNY